MAKCLLCGQETGGTFESRSKRLPNMAAAISQPIASPAGFQPGFSARRETPAHLPSRETHLDLPLAQAYAFGKLDAPIGGVIGFMVGLPLALLVDAASRDSFTFWGYAAIVGPAVIVGGVVAFHRKAKEQFPVRLGLYDGLLMKAEEATGLDLDGDGYIGEAPRVEVEIQEKGVPRETETVNLDLPRLKKFAYLVMVEKMSFSGRTAIEAGISREEEWVPFRDKMIGRRWATWKVPGKPTKGIILLPKGEAILKSLLPPALPGNSEPKNGGAVPPTQVPPTNYQRFEHIEE